jgi:NADH:ubiquinone oxidoreductase subunit 6 (subunit J)
VTHRNPVYAALYLLPMFVSMAVLYVMLAAPFLAAMQVLIYGGAIMVLFLFVVMMLDLGPLDLPDEGGNLRYVVGGFVGASLFALLSVGILGAEALRPGNAQTAFPEQASYDVGRTVAGRVQSSANAASGRKDFAPRLARGRLRLVIAPPEAADDTASTSSLRLQDDGTGNLRAIGPRPAGESAWPTLREGHIDYETGAWSAAFAEPLPGGLEIDAVIGPPAGFAGLLAPFGSVRSIAGVTFGYWLVPFELVGILLVVGIIGALLLTKQHLRRAGESERELSAAAGQGSEHV